MPKVVGKNAGAPEGSVVAWHIGGVDDGDRAIRVEDGRAAIMDSVPAEVDVRFVMDLETFVCLSCGRWPPERTDPRRARRDRGRPRAWRRASASSMNILY